MYATLRDMYVQTFENSVPSFVNSLQESTKSEKREELDQRVNQSTWVLKEEPMSDCINSCPESFTQLCPLKYNFPPTRRTSPAQWQNLFILSSPNFSRLNMLKNKQIDQKMLEKTSDDPDRVAMVATSKRSHQIEPMFTKKASALDISSYVFLDAQTVFEEQQERALKNEEEDWVSVDSPSKPSLKKES